MFNPFIFDEDIGKKLYSVKHSDDKDINAKEDDDKDKIKKRMEDRSLIDYSCWAFCK
jgi:hypothetical protein